MKCEVPELRKKIYLFLTFLLAVLLSACMPKQSASLPESSAQADDTVSAAEELLQDGVYDSKEDVALYLQLYGSLPGNYITKQEAEELGWEGGSLEPYAPGKCIGGNRFGN